MLVRHSPARTVGRNSSTRHSNGACREATSPHHLAHRHGRHHRSHRRLRELGRFRQRPRPTTASSQSGRSAGAAAVTISDFKFTPGALTVRQGARITVTNHDTTAHTATADSGNSFDTGNIDPGSSATFTLSKVGTYSYHCSIHPFMHGTVTVR